ncbi:MAG: MBL fold metallo-hydrolase [Planctomycetes bacterium]|nr:MBL fold metallo-hydrolase [Planctomycetota bacterium]
MSRCISVLAIALIGISCHTPTPDTESGSITTSSTSPADARTRVVLLGTGTPNADPDRSGPALAVVVQDRAYLVDCGPGVVRRAAAAHRSGIKALAVDNLTHVFITHLHTDHTLGYPDLIFTPWVLERSVPLEAFGPPGLRDMTDHLLAAYDQDIRIRLDGREPANAHGFRVNVHEISPGLIYQDSHVRVTAFPVRHGSWPHAFGYRFETADRTVVVSGDTAPSPSLIEHARGCDILVHEVYSQAGFDTRPPVWQRYHSQFHTSTTELAEIARQVQPKLLVLTHQLFWGSSPEDLLEEIARTYQGEVRSGSDLDVY